MNEKFEIEFRVGDQALPVEKLDSDGIVVGGEVDAFPRRFVMQLVPRSDVTRDRLRSVCNVEGWQFPQFRVTYTLTPEGRIRVEGVRPSTLPGGDYRVRVRVDDLTNGFADAKLHLSDKTVTLVPIVVTRDARAINITHAMIDMDGEIRRVVEASTLDGLPGKDWLTDVSRNTKRRACVLNLLAKLRCACDKDGSLIEYVQDVFFANSERIYVRVTGGFIETLEALADDESKPFYREGFPKAEIHQKLLTRVGATNDTHELISFRQEGKCSMQAVVARARNSPGQHYAELDIDLGNPLQDALGFVTHIAELVDGKPTNHLDLYAKLAKDKLMREFLYYDIA